MVSVQLLDHFRLGIRIHENKAFVIFGNGFANAFPSRISDAKALNDRIAFGK